MSITTTAQAVFATIATMVPAASVAVVYEGVSVTGIKDMESQASGVMLLGDLGQTSSRVWVSVADIAKPERGKSIMIGGEACFVESVKTDPGEALYEITYTKTQPIGD